jgi:hypothetical protein
MKKKTAILAGAAALATGASLVVPVSANAAPTRAAQMAANATAAALPTFDYRDCPTLPAGVDPAKWRCEVLVADGALNIGDIAPVGVHLTAVTHAEGRMPDGSMGQVFGGFRAASAAVPGGLFGLAGAGIPEHVGPRLTLQPTAVGPIDFLSPAGAAPLSLRLSGPGKLLGADCAIGTASAPVNVALARVPGSATWVSQDPPIMKFDAADTTFAIPAVSGCEFLDPFLDRRLGLPSGSGRNKLAVTAYYSFKTYDRL